MLRGLSLLGRIRLLLRRYHQFSEVVRQPLCESVTAFFESELGNEELTKLQDVLCRLRWRRLSGG